MTPGTVSGGCPFAGAGANLAMFDGSELGKAIARAPGDPAAAPVAYERPIFARGTEDAAMATESLRICSRDDAPQGQLDLFAVFER